MDLLNIFYKGNIISNVTPEKAIYNMRLLVNFEGSNEEFKQSYLINFGIYEEMSDLNFLLYLDNHSVIELEVVSKYQEVLENAY